MREAKKKKGIADDFNASAVYRTKLEGKTKDGDFEATDRCFGRIRLLGPKAGFNA